MRALDLFCGAGGASMGLARAGLEVVGIDIRPQPRYPFAFIRADALQPAVDLAHFDFLWASPPCQFYTKALASQEHLRAKHPDLVGETRELLTQSGLPWCMENVPGAPLRPDLVLTGSQFDLDVVRNRVFEIEGFHVPFDLVRPQQRTVTSGGLACVVGCGANTPRSSLRKHGATSYRNLPAHLRERLSARNCVEGWRAAMGIDWMTRDEMRNAVPPAYAEHIGRAAIKAQREYAA